MAGREYRFIQVDVFTDTPYRGNPLAVVLGAEGISDEEMQSIAREMNLSETTFVLPTTRPECAARVRIFTPGVELPFAGHPTIGTAVVLAREGLLPAGATGVALDEGIGPVPVTFDGDPGAPSFAWMRHGEATFGPALDNRDEFAEALGLSAADLLDAPICAGSTGLPHLYIPLRDRDRVDRATPNIPALLRAFGEMEPLGVFVVAPNPDAGSNRVYSRMFAEHTAGVGEDPATGSASGPLGAYLVRHCLVAGEGEVQIVSEQGVKMGRQSFVHIRLRATDGAVSDIEVGGSAVPVIEGTLSLP
jgi:trans-2,3-dihydro-3-hydroxyanthranilate isomerase